MIFFINGVILTPTNSILISHHSEGFEMVLIYIEKYKIPFFSEFPHFGHFFHEKAVETLNFDFFQKFLFNLIYKHKDASNKGGSSEIKIFDPYNPPLIVDTFTGKNLEKILPFSPKIRIFSQNFEKNPQLFEKMTKFSQDFYQCC